MSPWQIRIQEPSGGSRVQPLPHTGTTSFGRAESAALVLKDPTIPPEAGVFQFRSFNSADPQAPIPVWIKIPDHAPAGYLGDLEVREAQIPPGIPFRVGETILTLESRHRIDSARSASRSGAVREISELPSFPSGMKPWLTRSESGWQNLWLAKKASATPLSIYLAGETGTGKEVMAHLIHGWSERRSGPFVPLHCGALPLSLAESELFGHVKGAFTGAAHHRTGALMQAHGGTLFLDEVGDLPLDIQVKLLRFLENGEIRSVGADRPSKADVRLVCATHHPLQKLVEEKKFRQDLYYRLASVTLLIPTLRSRPEDIEMLAKKFALEFSRTLSPRALLRLKAHSWPGNVRELRHAVERACGLAGPFQAILPEEAFDFLLTTENISQTPELELGASALSLREMERLMLLKALKITFGNRTLAAKTLGVARSTLFEMLKRHRISGPRTNR